MPELFKKIIGMLMAENQKFDFQHGIMSDNLVGYNSIGEVIWIVTAEYTFHENTVKFLIYNPETKAMFTKTFDTAEEYINNIHWVNTCYP